MDHYRADEDAPVEPGVYRVVGSDEDGVTLLRVAADGRRVHTGEVTRVPRADLEALAPADDPDSGLGRVRQAPRNLAAHPLVSAVALAAIAIGGYLRVVEGVGVASVAVAAGLIALWLLVK